MNKPAASSLILLAAWLCGCASFRDKPLAPAKTAADFEARSLDDATGEAAARRKGQSS